MFDNNTLSFLVTLALCALASLPGLYPPATLPGAQLLRALSAAAAAPRPGLTIALATNVCVDLVVPAADVLPALPALPAGAAGDRAFLATPADAAAAFAHHAAAGAAGERSSAPAVMAALLAPAQASPRARHILGGNAALMAQKLARLGARVILGGRVGPKAAQLLAAGVAPAGALAAADDVHLILEYAAGEALLPGLPPAPRANRFIVTSGVPGEGPAALAEALARAGAAGAHALVLSGLHALESLPAQERSETLAATAAALAARPRGLPVHVELASVASAAFLAEVAAVVLAPHAASLGFNEGETAALYEALGGGYGGRGQPRERGELTALMPRVAAVGAALRHAFRALPLLTRAHFHSLAHHIVVHRVGGQGEGAVAGGAWPWSRDPAAAAAAGAVACAEQACDVPAGEAREGQFYSLCPTKLGVGDPEVGSGVSAVRRLALAAPAATWRWPLHNATSAGGGGGGAELLFAAVPVPVCAKPTRTVGLGDAVSAAALGADIAVPERAAAREL
jgi:ADP-dependent glucokinase